MSMHLPSAWIVPFEAIVQRWALVPLQVHSCTAVPLAVADPATSTHLPPMPVIGPVRPGCGWVPPVTVSKIAVTSEVALKVSWDSSQYMIPAPLAMAHWVLRLTVGTPL